MNARQMILKSPAYGPSSAETFCSLIKSSLPPPIVLIHPALIVTILYKDEIVIPSTIGHRHAVGRRLRSGGEPRHRQDARADARRHASGLVAARHALSHGTLDGACYRRGHALSLDGTCLLPAMSCRAMGVFSPARMCEDDMTMIDEGCV